MSLRAKPKKGRGALHNPHNRFETVHTEPDPESDPNDLPKLQTSFIRERAKTLITYNDSPDVGFDAGINPYRGCEHGCIYCFARPSHEYLSFSSGLDFESRIIVKTNAADVLRKDLLSAKYKPQPIALSGNTDCYQPVERQLNITRGCLQVLSEFRNPVAIITKNALIQRDLDILQELNQYDCVTVFISLTSLDAQLVSKMEPRASCPNDRLKTIKALSEAGIPVGVLVAPIIPGLTDEEIPRILESAKEAGAGWAGSVMLRLPFSVKQMFEDWLIEHFPDRSQKILNRIRSTRSGRLNDFNFKTRMTGTGVHADQIRHLFSLYRRRYGLDQPRPQLSVKNFRTVSPQLTFF